jgi:hypothetical protein
MATYTISHPGNLALQTEVWTLTIDEAQHALMLLDATKGSYWETTLLKPYRRARRQHLATVRVYTAGFSSGKLSNVLFNCDIAIIRAA